MRGFSVVRQYHRASPKTFRIITSMAILCPNCAIELEDGNKVCRQCATRAATHNLQISDPPASSWNGFSTESGPLDIGGWLSLVALGLIVSPLILLHALWKDINLLLGPTSKLAAKIIPDLPVLVLYEVMINLALLTSCLYLIVMFYRKKRAFPKYYCAWLVFAFVAIVVEYTFCLPQLSTSSATEAATKIVDHLQSNLAISAGKRFLNGAIWISYFIMSRRVKATFVN